MPAKVDMMRMWETQKLIALAPWYTGMLRRAVQTARAYNFKCCFEIC